MRKVLQQLKTLSLALPLVAAANEPLHFGPFESKPALKPSGLERIVGKIESGPFGGKAYYLLTTDRRQYIIGQSRDLPDDADTKLDQLSKQGPVVELQGYVIKNCSKAREAEGKIVGCNWLDLSKPFTLKRSGPEVQEALVEALRLRNADADNVATTKRALLAFARTGSIGAKPDLRLDYSDYYFAKKPTFLFGHRLFMIRSEHMETYLGCCARPAVEVALALDSRPDSLQEFADKNSCEFRREANMKESWERLGSAVTSGPPKGSFGILTCQVPSGGGSDSVMKQRR